MYIGKLNEITVDTNSVYNVISLIYIYIYITSECKTLWDEPSPTTPGLHALLP